MVSNKYIHDKYIDSVSKHGIIRTVIREIGRDINLYAKQNNISFGEALLKLGREAGIIKSSTNIDK